MTDEGAYMPGQPEGQNPTPPPPGYQPPPLPPGAAQAPAPMGAPSAVAIPPMAPPPVTPGLGLAAPQPKPRKTWIIVLVAVVLLGCLLVSCVGIFMWASGSGSGKTVTQAEAHYTKASQALGRASTGLRSLNVTSKTNEADTKKVIATSNTELRTARDEIATARASIETLDDSQGKTDYLASLDQATKSVAGLENLLGYVTTVSSMSAKLSSAGSAGKSAGKELNAAISAANSRKWSVVETKARAAAAGYRTAAAVFREANRLDPQAGLGKAASYADKRAQQAAVVVTMARDGRAGRTSAYNRSIDRMNAIGAQAESIGEPAIVSDPNWVENRLGGLEKAISTAAEQSDTLHAKALKELGVSK
jgi:hypothetical protein